MQRKAVIYVIDSRYAAADNTVDLRRKRGAAREVMGHIRNIRNWNYYDASELEDAPEWFKDPGDSHYTVSPTLMKGKYGGEIKHLIKQVDFVTVHK